MTQCASIHGVWAASNQKSAASSSALLVVQRPSAVHHKHPHLTSCPVEKPPPLRSRALGGGGMDKTSNSTWLTCSLKAQRGLRVQAAWAVTGWIFELLHSQAPLPNDPPTPPRLLRRAQAGLPPASRSLVHTFGRRTIFHKTTQTTQPTSCGEPRLNSRPASRCARASSSWMRRCSCGSSAAVGRAAAKTPSVRVHSMPTAWAEGRLGAAHSTTSRSSQIQQLASVQSRALMRSLHILTTHFEKAC